MFGVAMGVFHVEQGGGVRSRRCIKIGGGGKLLIYIGL